MHITLVMQDMPLADLNRRPQVAPAPEQTKSTSKHIE
jgi:hypothetical protein